MKKLKLILISLLPTLSLLTIGCGTGSSIDDIERPDPIMPISKTGFDKINIDDIEIDKFLYNEDLLKVINTKLTNAGYDLNKIDYKVFKNETQISMNDDLYRNGNYRFLITNKDNSNDTITAYIKIINSLYLQDNFNITEIGEVYDHRPNTLLNSLLFRNTSMIKYLQKIADELTLLENITYYKSEVENDVTPFHAKIQINDTIPKEKPKNFYGMIDLSYNIKTFDSSPGQNNINFPATFEEIIKDGDDKFKIKYSLGNLPDTSIYTVLMYLISINSINYNYWPIVLNDLDIKNIKPEYDKEKNQYSIRLFSKKYNGDQKLPESPIEQSGEYNNSSHYINDEKGILFYFTVI
ncbi:hypothetical protein SLITO_v1c03770 [Spiroplasma litorale]|uniref:Lipoprotein n=1 Tax=Spiroplasma litorale TaxID=216942 RepID=A0A0K1W125_9MOLU|nr:hypothetical protein [Spiroplasma litorale]AKX34030.1 hypothetical protein SLITO_v1c03770 [Spiroplasma litorale]